LRATQRAAWAAWELPWVTIIAIGAAELTDPVTMGKWEPLFEAFEAGGYAMWIGDSTIHVAPRPDRVVVNAQSRLHCETGPAFSWLGRDDYYWNGVAVPAHWIERRADIDPREVIKAENDEQRAAGAEICGWPKMLSVLKAKTIHDSGSEDMGALIEMTLPGLRRPGRFLKARCPRNGIIVEGVPYVSDIDGLPIETALAAQAWRVGDPQSEYQHPPRRT
jgi:hypothetical protein